MKLRLKDSFGMRPVGTKAASPLYLRKSSAFLATTAQEESGSAAGGKAAKTGDDATAKQSFAANRQAEPEDKNNLFYRVVGHSEDLDGAKELALNDRYGFQWWSLSARFPSLRLRPYRFDFGQPTWGFAKPLPQALMFVAVGDLI